MFSVKVIFLFRSLTTKVFTLYSLHVYFLSCSLLFTFVEMTRTDISKSYNPFLFQGLIMQQEESPIVYTLDNCRSITWIHYTKIQTGVPWRNPCITARRQANSAQQSPDSVVLNPGPSCCEGTVLTTVPPCYCCDEHIISKVQMLMPQE